MRQKQPLSPVAADSVVSVSLGVPAGAAATVGNARPPKIKVVSLCRVSTREQRVEGHSLESQEANNYAAARNLGIDETRVKMWSLDQSSRQGKNLKRKDLQEILTFCKRNKSVDYFIVDKVNRLMREMKLLCYYLVLFELEGVKVIFASEPELNTDDPVSTLRLMLRAYEAEADNRDRTQTTSAKMKARVEVDYYPFACHIGYKKGIEKAVHVPDQERFKLLREAGLEVASLTYTPGQALQRLHQRGFSTPSGGKLKIDKFKEMLVNEYYVGVVEVKGPTIQARCEKGLHQKMFTREEFDAIQRALGKSGKRAYKRQQFNPEFPLTNMLQCGDCGGKYTGSFQNNGKLGKSFKRYPKYRCRGCGKQYHREAIINGLNNVIARLTLDNETRSDLLDALTTVWEQKSNGTAEQIRILEQRVAALRTTKSKLVVSHAQSDPEAKADI